MMNEDISVGKISMEDFSHICRICLHTRDIIPIEENILHLFTIIPNFQVVLDDELPHQICEKCITKLKDISTFFSSVEENYLHLKKIINETKYKTNTQSDNDQINDGNCNFNDNSDNDSPSGETDSKFETPINLSKNECVSKRPPLIKCNECDKSFSKESKLKIHLRSHTKEAPHECKICLKKFRYAPNLKRHENITHKGIKPFGCDTCEKKFATLIRKTEHMRIHTGERPYVCNMCGLSFKKYSTYYSHERRHKIKNGLIPKSEIISKKYFRKPPPPSGLECKICQKILSCKQSLFVHKKIHSGEKPFLCTECGKSFIRKIHLEVHFRIHTGEKPYKCADCSKEFRQHASYRNHLFIHKNKRSFNCQICQKSFIQSGHLQNHLKTHTGEKPYKCTFCSRAFSQNGNLRAHMRIHTNERPYQCTICYSEYLDSSSLKKHMKTHSVGGDKTE